MNGEIITVRRGSIAATVSATGVIQPKQQIVLTFKSSGRVLDILVEKGQLVTKGQPLAALERDDVERQVRQAELSVGIAEQRLAQLQNPPKPEDVAAAQAALRAAQENLARLQDGPSETQLAAAKASLDAAQKRYDLLVAGPTDEDIQRAKLAVDQAKNSLWGAQNARDSTGFQVQLGGPRAPLDQAEAQVLNAEIAVTLAEMNQQDLLKGPSNADISAALASLEQARDAYASLQMAPRQSDLAAAESQVTQAQASLARLQTPVSEQDLAVAKAQVDQAQLTLDQAQAALDGVTLMAPFDGTIASVQVDEGALVTAATPALVLVDLSKFTIEVNVDEIDIVNVKVGQPVALTLDALPDETIAASVASIAPVATNTGGVVSYVVAMDVDASNPDVRAGMSANAEITTLRKDNVLLVPNRAIRIDRNDGTYHVEVWNNGDITDVQIVPGMRNDLDSEVVRGLSEGTDLIIRSTSLTDRVANGLFGG